ncbi:hypothetical protein [Spirillospora sp. NPDC047279]|uniref:hypothetical protein n=1 Tax=Spirillospora sp. NPDC047279 TaxID=3155478 RepID=UPI0033FC2850
MDDLSVTRERGQGADRSRRAEARRVLDSMEQSKSITDGHFSALGMLITDASLSADEAALVEVKDGLQWFHRTHYHDVPAFDGERREQRGRILGLIDCAHWALRRLPSGLQLGLQPGGHAARFLVAVAKDPGLSNQDLAGRLGADETEVSRVGRRLLAAGVVWRRKEWRRNCWDVTPRGRAYLEAAGLLDDAPADGARPDAAASGPATGTGPVSPAAAGVDKPPRAAAARSPEPSRHRRREAEPPRNRDKGDNPDGRPRRRP